MRTISCLGLVLASLGLFIAGMPHLRLAAGLVSGQIDGTPVSVSQLEHAHFQGSTVSIRCGALTLQVPLCATIERTSPDTPAPISLEVESLKCTAFPPRESCSDGRDGLFSEDQEQIPGKDLIAWRASICRASGEDFTFWTSAAEISRVRRQLELRPLYCLRAERVEVFHGKDLSGLLLIWTNQGRPRMAFEYVSSNGSLHGSVVMFADADCDQAAYTARAILCALRIDPAAN